MERASQTHRPPKHAGGRKSCRVKAIPAGIAATPRHVPTDHKDPAGKETFLARKPQFPADLPFRSHCRKVSCGRNAVHSTNRTNTEKSKIGSRSPLHRHPYHGSHYPIRKVDLERSTAFHWRSSMNLIKTNVSPSALWASESQISLILYPSQSLVATR